MANITDQAQGVGTLVAQQANARALALGNPAMQGGVPVGETAIKPAGAGAVAGNHAPARSPLSGAARMLTGRQKAAIIVRLLIAEGAQLPLSDLPEEMQAALTQQMGEMRLIDRNTLAAVVDEFLETLDQVGLSFPDGIDGALSMLDGHISASAANRLRRMSWGSASFDLWEQIATTDLADLTQLVETESTEVGSVILSKLKVSKAAALLSGLPGDKARRLACAMSDTSNTNPAIVRRIGISVLQQLGMRPASAFETPATARMGAILNASAAALRDALLQTLDENDATFAQEVRRAIFTFADIPTRLIPRDVPRLMRDVDQAVSVRAFKYALANPGTPLEAAAEFLLASMQQRLAGAIREEIEAHADVRAKDGEAAMSAIVETIRSLTDSGQLTMIAQDED